MRYTTFATIALLASSITIAHTSEPTLRDWTAFSVTEKMSMSEALAKVAQSKYPRLNATSYDIMVCIDGFAEREKGEDSQADIRSVAILCAVRVTR